MMGNKIIEYDGTYWHNPKKDEFRNLIYKKNGYDVLVISEKHFARKNKNAETVTQCLEFLRHEN